MASNNYNKRPITTGRPVMPSAPSRTKTGPVVTPRLAGAASPDTSRRPQGPPRIAAQPQSDDAPTPNKGFLSANVTPRSGARKTKTESNPSTPNGTPGGTPSNSRPTSVMSNKEKDVFSEPTLGIGISGAGIQSHSRAGSTISNAVSGAEVYRGVSPERSFERSTTATSQQSQPKFFHASDARNMPSKPSSSVSVQSKGSAFFYANGQQGAQQPAAPMSTPASSQQRPKFYRANGTPEAASIGKRTPSPSASRSSPKIGSFSQPRATPGRSTSPLKEFETVEQLQPRSGPKSSIESKTTPTQMRPVSVGVESPLQFTGRQSSQTSVSSAVPHRKSQSTTSISSSITGSGRPNLIALDTKSSSASELRVSDASSSFITDPEPFPVQSAPVSTQAQFTAQSLTSASEPSILPRPSAPTSPLTSPTHSSLAVAMSTSEGQSKLDQANALAAQARRERKVLDLEISNSSLLAINRTLERELRKQKLELRRYKRLTSSGRISLPTTSRNTSAAYSTADTQDTLSDDDGEDEDEDSDLSDLSSSTNDSSGSGAEAKERRKEQDSRRLQLDLERHQALLADSQRMNASLKRCLTWTEELIADGKKALAYTVKVSDVRVGGRVLAHDDVPDYQEGSRGLLSPGLKKTEEAGYGWEDGQESHQLQENGNADGADDDDDEDAPSPINPISPLDGILVGRQIGTPAAVM